MGVALVGSVKNPFSHILSIALLFVSTSAFASYEISYSEQPKFQLIEFSGEIMPQVGYAQLNSVIQQITGKKDIVLLVGESMGGYTHRFKKFFKQMRDRCSSQRGSKCKVTSVFLGQCGSSLYLFSGAFR